MSNPYELRLNVLNLAKNILERKQEVEMYNISKNSASSDSDETTLVSGSISTNKTLSINSVVTPYTTDDIIDEANKLYSFVNNRETK